jgi:spore coat polysaccharide biosynthesis protein SpsF
MAAETVAAIVQARMGSSRFPGKSLAPFGEATVLEQILDRLERVSHPLQLWVATSDRKEDDAIATVCVRRGVAVARGPEEDVLARFVMCIDGMPDRAALVLRVCADRPLLCPVLTDELLDAYDELGRPDYLSNNLVPSYPDGLDLELVRTDALYEAHRESVDPYEREHVTPFVYRRPERFSVRGLICPYGNYAHVRAALDTPADLERLSRMHSELAARDPDYDYRDLLNLATVRPELAE